MIRSSVTVSLVPEVRGGPFIFWDDLAASCRMAQALGFDGIEIFAGGPDAFSSNHIQKVLNDHGLALAAVGTGAGWVKHRVHLCLRDASARSKAGAFVRSMIDAAGPLGAPVIVGSMQGRSGEGVDAASAMGYLSEALAALSTHAQQYNVPLLLEPLNRYETNLVNTIEAGLRLLQTLPTTNVRLLADLFHMNIEETDIPAAIRAGGAGIGHVHFVDSNRRPAGLGHLPLAPIASAFHEIGFAGFASAEALPYPDPDAAARQTMQVFRRYFRSEGQTNYA
jgi:sugar phosphate isomerase/epimerase